MLRIKSSTQTEHCSTINDSSRDEKSIPKEMIKELVDDVELMRIRLND